MLRVLDSGEQELLGLEKFVIDNISIGFIVNLTVDIFYARCALHKIDVVDRRGMCHCLMPRCH
jgi:hypothetical protein